MAALYVFIMFRTESKNVLDSGSLSKFLRKYQSKPAVGLVHSAWMRTSSAQLGHYDMFLRFLCGLLSPDCYHSQLGGYLFPHNAPKLCGLDEVQQLLQQTIKSASEDRIGNLKECLREMTQEDEWVGVKRKPLSVYMDMVDKKSNLLHCSYLQNSS